MKENRCLSLPFLFFLLPLYSRGFKKPLDVLLSPSGFLHPSSLIPSSESLIPSTNPEWGCAD